MTNPFKSSAPHRFFTFLREMRRWKRRGYAAPSPHFIKQACLLRNGIVDATWVETGTFMGSTTAVLARQAKMVHSIEPEPTLFANAAKRFEGARNVEILKGVSEEIFPVLLPKISGDVSFWLDGHYSAGTTFQGAKDTPIVEELRCIGENIGHFGRLVVLVDDLRCFDPSIPEFAAYPPRDFLVDWARQHGLRWHIEHDIFVARNF